MNKRSSISLFLAATSALTIAASNNYGVKAGESDIGGLKEWNTDMAIDEDFILDEEAQRLADKAKKESVCVPIGEGENCW